MLPNRTYNELNESCFSQTELSEEAKLLSCGPFRQKKQAKLASAHRRQEGAYCHIQKNAGKGGAMGRPRSIVPRFLYS